MEKQNKLKPNNFKILLAVMVMIAAMAAPGYCQGNGYALMIQQSPADAGFVTPQTGVHNIKLDDTIMLSAVAKQGYRFMYWLGDVDDMVANETTIFINSPKIVIAVFERVEYELLAEIESVEQGAGAGRLSRRASDFRMGSPVAVNEPKIPSKPNFPSFPDPPREDLPVPDGDEQVPEPSTLTIFALGVSVLIRKRNRKQ